ncbi:MAG: PKD domain-containing protein [Planctomycetota bacterium]
MNGATNVWDASPTIINQVTGYHYRPSIATDINDNVHIVWYGYPTYYRIKYREYNAASSSWGSVIQVSTSSGSQYYPSVGTDQRGYVYVTWYGYPSPNTIYLRVDKGSGFGTQEEITSDSSIFYSSQYYPSILGYGPNCYPEQGAALVWSGYYRDPVTSTTSTPTMFYSTDDFWLGHTFEETKNKVKFDLTSNNVDPAISFEIPSMSVMVGEPVDIKFTLSDLGSDDLTYKYDFADGSAPVLVGPFYNDGSGPDPYPSALYGRAPFTRSQTITHTFLTVGEQLMNVSLWDDDGGEANCVNGSVPINVLGPKQLKEEAIKLLEPLVPGRADIIGYENVTLEYLGEGTVTVMAYNYISQMPMGWEMKHLYTFCNVTPNSEIFVDASGLPTGMFGTKLVLKVYNDDNELISETEIPTAWSVLFKLQPGQMFGGGKKSSKVWLVTAVGAIEGLVYQHQSRLAVQVEDALDDILFSINKDPRRGYGWWHSHWVFFCGDWYNRQLWIDDGRLDPVYGSIVFCEERNAVLHLMTVINNVLKPNGVLNMTFRWTGDQMVDIEVYRYNTWWVWWGNWELMQTINETDTNDTFTVDPDGPTNFGKLKPRILIKMFKYDTGELLDAVYIRTSGYWPLELEAGNMYGHLEVVESNLKSNNGKVWRSWQGDWSWWDYFDWETSRAGGESGCGWMNKKCSDPELAAEEIARIGGNLTRIKMAIDLLVKADYYLANLAYLDAQNATVADSANDDEYAYHLKMAKRYMLRAAREADEGRPFRAISDYKTSWKNSILAVKWALKSTEDPDGTEDPGEAQLWPDVDPDCPGVYDGPGKKGGWFKGPWWLWWYVSFGSDCKWKHQDGFDCMGNC